MIGCMTCSLAQMAGRTTDQSGQRNDGATAPNTQQLHHRLGHIIRTLHADIEKPTTLKKNLIGRRCLVLHQPSPPSYRRSRPWDSRRDGGDRWGNVYGPSSAYIIPPVAPVSFVTSRRRRLVVRSRPRDRRDRRSCPRSRPRRTRSPPAASLVIPTISSTFSSNSAIEKFRNARQTKMADVDSNIQHRQVTLKNHCT